MSKVKSLKRSLSSGAVLAATLLLVGNVASAGVISSFTVGGGGPSSNLSGIHFQNFNSGLPIGPTSGPTLNSSYSLNNGLLTLSFKSDGQVVQGPNVGGRYAAPYLTSNDYSAADFGTLSSKAIPGKDPTPYITSGQTPGNATLTFSGDERYLGLLWGSIDHYNNLSFYATKDTTGNALASFSGKQVDALAYGNQYQRGTHYVNINLSTPFHSVVATSTQHAFEFDNVAFRDSLVSEPNSLGLLALGLTLLGFGVWKRKSNQRNLIE